MAITVTKFIFLENVGQFNNRERIMCSIKSHPSLLAAKLRPTVSICLSAAIGLGVLLPMQNASAVECSPDIACGVSLNPASGSKVVLGQKITINFVKAGITASSCFITNGNTWMASPDGSGGQITSKIMNEFAFATVNTEINCNGAAGVPGGDAACLSYPNTYIVSAADINQPLALGSPTVLPNKFAADGVQTFPAIPKQIHFFAAAEGVGYNDSGFTSFSGNAYGQGQVFLTVVAPGLTIDKICDTNCFLYGGPISFHGTICNTGDVTIVGITVTDTPSGGSPLAITNFAATTSSGRPFNGTLTNGECVNYSGSYLPDGSGAALCGPFTDTVVVEGTTSGISSNFVVSATNSATCNICNNPCIAVTKDCDTVAIGFGNTVSGIVTNCGNVPLTNITIVDNLYGTLATYLSLAVGESQSYSVLVTNSTCGSFPNFVTASGTSPCGGTVTAMATNTCVVTESPGITVTKECPPIPTQPGGLLVYSGVVSNAGNITLTNVIVVNDQPTNNSPVLGPITLLAGASVGFTNSYTVPADSCGPYVDTLAASAISICGTFVTNSATATCAGTNTPSIDVTKACPANPVQPGGLMVVNGTVTNTGNITLTNVVVTNNISALEISRRVLGPITLAPGEGTTFSDSYTVPLDSCGPYPDTFTASGADKCFGVIVTDFDTQACAGTNTPSIDVTKACPANPVQPGGLMVVNGTVTNTGNITLTNVVVTNNISALEISRRVLGPITLAPGEGTTFSDSYTVPLDSCGPYPDTFTASGADKCFGVIVTDFDTQACVGTNSPRLTVIKRCPAVPAAPGQVTTISGVVSNAGNVTLTNILVFDDQPAPNTLLLGPIALAPGQSAGFTNSYRLPPNCCTYVDTINASGKDKCFGKTVTASATVVCPTATDPQIAVTKTCPPQPVPLGEPLIFSGIVSNAGNITLTNVTVVNDQPSNNTPVFGPITLAPGETANFIGSYIVPTDICDSNILDTLTARANNLCNGGSVSASHLAICPIVPTPRLVVTKNCPANPVPPGGLLEFSGIVSNAGNITLTNVIVVNDHPTNNTPVFGPVMLAPGQSTNFSGSYHVCPECCPPYVDTLSASGAQICNGSNVSATATAYCPGISTPRLSVTVDSLPSPVLQGELLFYSGTVSNAGDITVGGIEVSDDKAGHLADIFALAPGETADFFSSFVPTNCGSEFGIFVMATAFDVCTGGSISNQVSAYTMVICPKQGPTLVALPPDGEEEFKFALATVNDLHYSVEITPSLSPVNWQPFTNFTGNGGVVTISDTATNQQRFYRVIVK